MKYKRIGFYREMSSGRETDDSIFDNVDKQGNDMILKICKYLESGILIVISPGGVEDIIDSNNGIIATPSLYTDGKWIWPEELSYYVKNYKLKLPQEFVNYMISNDWKINFSGGKFRV